MQNDTMISINTNRVVSETIDGETILINLESGAYYSMNVTGSFMWQAIEAGTTIADLESRIATTYGIAAEVASKEVNQFVEKLADERLIVTGPVAEKSPTNVSPLTSPSKTTDTFVPPTFDKYEDMQEMLLADPVHDVDVSGWPTRKDA